MSAIDKRGVGKRAIADTYSYAGDSRFRPSNGRKAAPLTRPLTDIRPLAAVPVSRPKPMPMRPAIKKPAGPAPRMRPDVARHQLPLAKPRPLPVQPTPSEVAPQVRGPQPGTSQTAVPKPARSKRRLISAAVSAALVAIIAVSGYLAFDTWHDNRQIAAAAKSSTGNGVDDIDETPVTSTQVDSYAVASDMPRYLTVPTLNIKARVQTTIVDTSTNQMGAPTNLDDVAWYRGGAKPGDPGLTFIDAHNQGWTRAGVFKHLGDLKEQQTVSVEMGDGRQYDYEITSVVTMPVQDIDMASLLAPPDSTGSYLVLMTCGGSYDHQSAEYQQRVVVKATLVKA